MKNFYVTTPIFYVNAAPHVGNFYTTLAADILARAHRLAGDNVFSLVGTDEHGQKVAEGAAAAGLEPKEYADTFVPQFKEAWTATNINYDYFIRTTDVGHEAEVKRIFAKLHADGHVYSGLYEGLYCVGCEKFIVESEMVDGRCPHHPNKELIHQKEKNYFFNLKKWAPTVLQKIQSGELKIVPEKARQEIVSRLEQGAEDISISRESVSWGIPVPWDNTHTLYVWVEALFNYYTVTRFVPEKEAFWPAQVHLIGKDIVWFHAVIWPALLLAAGLPLPECVLANGFFTVDGQKMAKSLGNVLTPGQLVERYGVDGARYVVISAVQFGSDGDVSLAKFDEAYTADLANGLGNLVARTAKLGEGLEAVERPEISLETFTALDLFNFTGALENIWTRIAAADKYLNEQEPWKIKDDEDRKNEIILKTACEIVRIAVDLQPFLPETAGKILKQFCEGKISVGEALFPRIA